LNAKINFIQNSNRFEIYPMNAKSLYEVDSLFGSIPFQIVKSLNDVSFIYEPSTKISFLFLHQNKNNIDKQTIHEMNKVTLLKKILKKVNSNYSRLHFKR
jgi:hypothetical protein